MQTNCLIKKLLQKNKSIRRYIFLFVEQKMYNYIFAQFVIFSICTPNDSYVLT